MKTTDLKTSKELAAALTGAGYEFKPEKRHIEYQAGGIGVFSLNDFFVKFSYSESNRSLWYYGKPAFTMSELWEMLPNNYIKNGLIYILVCSKNVDNSFACYYENNGDFRNEFDDDTNPCNALARLAIWCIENNHPLNLPKR